MERIAIVCAERWHRARKDLASSRFRKSVSKRFDLKAMEMIGMKSPKIAEIRVSAK